MYIFLVFKSFISVNDISYVLFDLLDYRIKLFLIEETSLQQSINNLLEMKCEYFKSKYDEI